MRGVPRGERWWLPALLVALVLGALLAGCGGGDDDDGPSQDALRSRLSAAFEKTDGAESIRILDYFEILTGEGEDETSSGCLDIAVEHAPGDPERDERFAMQGHADNCENGPVTGEVVLVGRSLWVSSGDGKFRVARIAPKLVPELTDQGLDFDQLPSVATEIELGDEPTGEAAADAGPSYEFDAPGSALSDVPGADSAEVEFEATTDSRGYLTGLQVEIEAEGGAAIVEQTYEEIGELAPIEPPPENLIVGRPRKLDSEAELTQLVSSLFPEQL